MKKDSFKAWLADREAAAMKLPPTAENVALAKQFLLERWRERASSLGRQNLPDDLKGACKFGSLFAQAVFGGKLEGNWAHQVVKLGDMVLDLTGQDDLPSHHDKAWWGNRDHREALDSCRTRVDKWVEEFKAFVAANRVTESAEMLVRYVHKDGRGLMNNQSLNYDKLDDDEALEVEDEYLGLQQPPSSLHGKEVVFAFTPEGEQRHRRLIELLTKASKRGVRREFIDPSQYDVAWQSSDGQIGLVPKGRATNAVQ